MSAMKGFQVRDIVPGFPAWTGFIELEKQVGVATIVLRVVYGKIWIAWCYTNTYDVEVLNNIAKLFNKHFRIKDQTVYRNADRKGVVYLEFKNLKLHTFLEKFGEFEEDLMLLSIWG